jgi:hypothetical protein
MAVSMEACKLIGAPGEGAGSGTLARRCKIVQALAFNARASNGAPRAAGNAATEYEATAPGARTSDFAGRGSVNAGETRRRYS